MQCAYSFFTVAIVRSLEISKHFAIEFYVKLIDKRLLLKTVLITNPKLSYRILEIVVY